MSTVTKIEVIVEKADDILWAHIEGKGDFLPATQAKTIKDVLQNLRTLIKGYQKHEGKKDAFWKKVNADTVEFNLRYDMFLRV
jgi:predicted RNase H-like HicB family nuclease